MKKLNALAIIVAALFLGGGGFFLVNKRNNADHIPPEIILENDQIECSITATEEELKTGVTASDNKDGDITDRILIDDIRIRQEEQENDKKIFDITYVVFDSNSNMTTASRTLIYNDYVSPHFSIADNLQFASASAVQLYSLISANDCIDGDITNQINIQMGDSFKDAISPGEYDCKLNVTNSVGDTASLPITFDVMLQDATRPYIALKEYCIYLKRGSNFKPRSYLDFIAIDNVKYALYNEADVAGQIPFSSSRGYGYYNQNLGMYLVNKEIKVSSDVDTNVPGTYTVTFSYKHPEEGTRGFAKLFVIVE